MILEIQTGQNNPVLRKKSQTIEKINEEILALAKDMLETMAKNNGAGLAACQVGKNVRLFVIPKELSKKQIFINPEIIKISKKTNVMEEGCFSLPETFIPIKRAESLIIKSLDENGRKFKLKAKDLLARAIQHEIDHLNGVLITDRYEKIKTILIGTSEFAERIFRGIYPKLKSRDFEIITIVTTQDKPIGRKQILTPSPVKKWAQENNLPILQPDKIKNPEWLEKIKELKPDLIILTAYGQMIQKEILEIPKYGTLNIHPSLLPKYRGASPIQAVILNGDEKTGVTMILMDKEMDHGSILASTKLQISNSQTYKELSNQLADMGAELLIKILPDWISGKTKAEEQNHSKATFCKIIKKEDGKIDWNKSAEEIKRQIRAFSEWPGTYTFWRNNQLKILEANLLTSLGTSKKIGEVFLDENKNLCVQTGNGILILEHVQLEGKKPMSAKDFLNGHPKIVGAILF